MQRETRPENDKRKERLREILSILRRHEVTRGITPEKLMWILTDLGPTFIKMGQILSMRPDILPKAYCEALASLRSDVTPMPFSEVKRVIERSFGESIAKVYMDFSENPLGSASIAQAHSARLLDGQRVVVKVQREGIYEKMAMDIALLRRAAGLMQKLSSMGGVLDFNMLLSEMWSVAQEEMNFLKEAENAVEFLHLNADVAYATCPIVYRQYTTQQVLTMEYVEGYAISERERLITAGYDLREIGTKLADNYIKQIVEDGFFHADPHPGNICVREGKIVWIDLGMMGRLSTRDQKSLGKAVEAVARHDVNMIKEILLTMGDVRGKVNHARLYTDIDDLLTQYGSAELGHINMANVLESVLEVAKTHQIAMPEGMSMLARGLATIEGVLADLSPEVNIVEIAMGRMSNDFLKQIDWQGELKSGARAVYESSRKALDIPALISDALKLTMKGQTKINLDLNATDDFSRLARELIGKLIKGLLIGALLISSSLLCAGGMQPRLLGVPLPAILGYAIAFALSFQLLWGTRKK